MVERGGWCVVLRLVDCSSTLNELHIAVGRVSERHGQSLHDWLSSVDPGERAIIAVSDAALSLYPVWYIFWRLAHNRHFASTLIRTGGFSDPPRYRLVRPLCNRMKQISNGKQRETKNGT
jgi:hypothetical protein